MCGPPSSSLFFFFNDTATTEIYTLSLHDALPIYRADDRGDHERGVRARRGVRLDVRRSEEHTSELQSRLHLVCRLLLEKKKLDQKAHQGGALFLIELHRSFEQLPPRSHHASSLAL